MKCRKYKVYLVSVFIVAVIAGVGGWVTGRGLPAYALLRKPALMPPAIVFPVVWSVLYLLMAVSSGKVYLSPSVGRFPALIVYALQLTVNLLWSFLFFGSQKYLLAFWWILLLMALVSLMVSLFYRVSKTAAVLQLPYLVWLALAAYLNLSVYLLNRL